MGPLSGLVEDEKCKRNKGLKRSSAESYEQD